MTPRNATADNPRLFDVLPFCSGCAFRWAWRNRDGAIFATDNQGHYNPFNELNHLIPKRTLRFFQQGRSATANTVPAPGRGDRNSASLDAQRERHLLFENARQPAHRDRS